MPSAKPKSERSLRAELKRVKARLAESEATIKAIQSGDVDAVVVDGPNGSRIFTLQSPEDPYRILAERMNEGAATLTAEGTLLFCNRRLAEMVGLPAERLLGSSFAALLREQDRPAVAELLRSAMKNDIRADSHLLRPDGGTLPVQISLSSIPLEGSEQGICLVATDLCEQKRAQEARERLAAIVDSSDDAIISKDLDGTINAWNRGAEKVFGYSSSEAVGKSMRMLLPPERANEETDILERIGRGESVEHFETIGVRKDGKRIDVSVTISPIRDNNGVIVGASKVARDITDRKRTEEALRQSDARRKFALETAKVGDWELDLTTLQATRSLLHDQIFGYQSLLSEWNFDIFLRHVHPDDRERVRENFQSSVSHEKKWEFECRIDCPDGDIRWIWACGNQCQDSSGKTTRMFGIVQDITDRKRVEEALREQSQVMDSAQVFVRDMESRVVFWPRGAEKLYGFNSQEALGILSHDLFHTEFPEPLKTIEKKVLETGVWEGELIHRKRDGSTIVVSSAWVLHRDGQGRPARILETNIDITARKQATEELAGQAEELSRQAEELARSRLALEEQTLMLRSVLNSMTEGLAAADEQGKFVLWNTAAEKILGMGAADLPSEKWTEHYGLFLNDTVTPFPSDQIPMVRAIRGEVSTTEMFVRNPKIAEGAWIEVCSGPLRDKHGVVRGGVAAFRDITRSRADEREIRKLNDELEIRVMERTAQLAAANKELEAFSYSVSHDLRAPLRHIIGFSQLLVEEFGPTLAPEAHRYLERIQAGTQKMGLLVDELLNLARVGRHALNLRTTKLNELVAEVVAMMQPDCEGRQVEWAIADLSGVKCDPVLVKQIFQNLLANALKFTRPRTHAVIEVSHQENAEDGQPVFMVRDNGIGFDMKYVDKLFGVFQRLHRPEDFEGTGIGLATVQRIVHKHGGQVWAEGELDKGAAFYFTLGAGKQAETKSNGATAGGQL